MGSNPIGGTNVNNMENIKKLKYNNIPVHYCKYCLSLAIKKIDNKISTEDYCENCGATTIGVTHIGLWESMYKEKYGKPFLVRKKNKQ